MTSDLSAARLSDLEAFAIDLAKSLDTAPEVG